MIRTYHVKADPTSRYGGRRIMVSEGGALYRSVGIVPAKLAPAVCRRIEAEAGELPADVIRLAHAANAATPGARKLPTD
jgi:hypothetical protein